jgi:putative tricarboxylic transport membrane protein
VRSYIVRDLAPYFVVLAAACYLYYRAELITFSAIPGRMGPDVWPKISLACLGAICAIAIVRRAVGFIAGTQPAKADPSVVENIGSDEDMEALAEESHPVLVGAAVGATVVFLLVIETIGFFLSAFALVGVLMLLGGMRRVRTILPLSLACAIFFMFLFQKIIFVALPIGVEPFSRVSTTTMSLLGIH